MPVTSHTSCHVDCSTPSHTSAYRHVDLSTLPFQAIVAIAKHLDDPSSLAATCRHIWDTLLCDQAKACWVLHRYSRSPSQLALGLLSCNFPGTCPNRTVSALNVLLVALQNKVDKPSIHNEVWSTALRQVERLDAENNPGLAFSALLRDADEPLMVACAAAGGHTSLVLQVFRHITYKIQLSRYIPDADDDEPGGPELSGYTAALCAAARRGHKPCVAAVMDHILESRFGPPGHIGCSAGAQLLRSRGCSSRWSWQFGSWLR